MHLCGGDGAAVALSALAVVKADSLTAGSLGGLLNDLLALSEDHLNVAGVGHVRVDATVGTVCAAALLGGLVDLDVLDNQVGGVKTLGVGVGLGVLEEREDELGRLDGPAGLGDTKLLALGGAASAPGITSHGDSLGVVLDVLEVLDGTGDLPAVDGLSGLTGVLERDTEVGTASAGALGVLDFGSGVTDLKGEDVLVESRIRSLCAQRCVV